MDELLQLPAELSKIETLQNGALKLVFNTQENIPDELAAKVMGKREKTGWINFSSSLAKNILPKDILDLPDIVPEDGGKSPAQRLRAVLWIYWDQKGKEGDFETFYKSHIQKLIDKIKERLT